MSGLFFRISTKDFSLELSCDGERATLSRNSSSCSIEFAPIAQRVGNFLLVVLWSSEKLSLSIHDKSGQRHAEVETPKSSPPNSLVEAIRRNSLASQNNYIGPDAFFEEVVSQLQILTERIYANNAFDLFWDTVRDGQKIAGRFPKREPEIHTSIRQLLDHLEIQRGWSIVPEYPAGAGKLDFLISGRLAEGREVHVCVEFKLAHSDDLAHGLYVQLPEYMDKRATDYGVYCVIDYGGVNRAKINQFKLEDFTDPECSLDLVLPIAANNTGKAHVRALIIDVSKPISPSKM